MTMVKTATVTVATGATTTIMSAEIIATGEDNHEVHTVKKPTGRHDYQEDYNKALKGPCQIHPKSNHTMENCRFLKNIYAKQLTNDDATKAIDNGPWRDGDDDDDDE
jgi:hypothetical protein